MIANKKIPTDYLWGYLIQKSDSIDKPSSVVYDHLSSPAVADRIKPPYNGARRADA